MSNSPMQCINDALERYNNLSASIYGTTCGIKGDGKVLMQGDQVVFAEKTPGQLEKYLEKQIRSMATAAIEERLDQIRFEEITPEQANLMAIRLRPMTNMLLVMPDIGSSITKDLPAGDPAISLLKQVLEPAALFAMNPDGSARATIPAVMAAMLLSYYLR